MRLHFNRYQNLGILKWIYVLSILLCSDGHSNYLPPQQATNPIELVASDWTSNTRDVSYQKILLSKVKYSTFPDYATHYLLLSSLLTNSTHLILKTHTSSVAIDYKKHIIQASFSQNSSEEGFLFITG